LELDPSRGVDPSARDNDALRYASLNGHTEIVRMLLELDPSRGVDPSANNNQAIRYASNRGHTEIVRMLLEVDAFRGVDPSANDSYALRIASGNGHTKIVGMLLELDLSRGVDPSARDNDALRIAARLGFTEVMVLLLRLAPSRGVALSSSPVLNVIYRHNLLSVISEEIFSTYDWSINLTEAHVHALLQHRFISFERWCREDNFHRLSDNVKSVVREYAFTRTRLYRKRKLPPQIDNYI